MPTVDKEAFPYRTYSVSASDREPLLTYMLDALRAAHCRIIRHTPPNIAPFRISFETPWGERMGIVAYAFFANQRVTTNRPTDERRFQVKYGSKDGAEHELWQDPWGLYTTLFLGVDTAKRFFVGADPVLHSPTKFFISVEFKEEHAVSTLRKGWHVWERERRSGDDSPVEVLVGGTADAFLRYVLFERDALGEEQGHRQLIAEKAERLVLPGSIAASVVAPPSSASLHVLAEELELSESEVLDLIQRTPRLKMAVRGWVAEEHLVRALRKVPGVTQAERPTAGETDVLARFQGSQPIRIECKNVLRKKTAAGLARVDFQRTRASKEDPCSRYYSPKDFDVVAACLHAVSEHWEFRYALPAELDRHPRCDGKLASNVSLDKRWTTDAAIVLRAAAV